MAGIHVLAGGGGDHGEEGVIESRVICVLERHGRDMSYLVVEVEEDASSPDEPYRLSSRLVPHLSPSLRGHLLKECPLHLRPIPGLVNIIVSTKSGTGLAAKVCGSVVKPVLELVQGLHEPIEDSGSTSTQGYEVITTKSRNTIKEFVKARLAPGCPEQARQTIILLSGDGGIVDLLNRTDEVGGTSQPPNVSILPLGTGNALFHSIHKPFYQPDGPTPLVLGLRTLCRGAPAPLPVFRASFSPRARLVPPADEAGNVPTDDAEPVDSLLGAIVASYGFHSSIVWESDTPEHRRHGDKRFGMVAAELLRESHAYEAEVSVRPAGSRSNESRPIPGPKFGYLLASMVSNLERTFEINPAGRPLDGKMRLVHFGPVGGERTMEIMKAAYAEGAHVDMEDVGYNEIEELEVKILEGDARWRKLCIDGTIVEVEQGGWMKVKKTGESPLALITI